MKKILSSILVIAIFIFLFLNISKNWGTISQISWDLNSITVFWFLFFLIFIYISNIFSWHIITKFLKLNLDLLSDTKIWMISNFSRFIPGGIWQYPSRVVLLSKKGVSRKNAITAVLIEGLMTLSFGAATVFFSLSFWQLPIKYQGLQNVLWIFLFSPLVILLFTNKRVLSKAISFYSMLIKKQEIPLESIKFNMKWLPLIFITFFCRFFFIGGALFFLIKLALPISNLVFPATVGIYALSWLLGYITLFAPAGLGVTEVTLAALLSLYIPFSLAAVIAIIFRLTILITEAFFLFASCVIKKD